jgi:hypothetical protein
VIPALALLAALFFFGLPLLAGEMEPETENDDTEYAAER